MNKNNTPKLIDFHTHIFPDAIALRAAESIGNYYSIPIEGDGTVSALTSNLPEGFDTRFVISSATLKAKNAEAGNNFLLESAKNDRRFIPFGSVHPDMGEKAALSELERVKSLGAKGVKLHPDFQHIFIDGEYMLAIYKECEALELPVLFHVGDKNTDYSTPVRLYRIVDKFPRLKVIAAHLGGYSVWDEAEKLLVGTDIYMDSSEALPSMPSEQVFELIKKHGTDKVLFGSDYPVRLTGSEFADFDALPFTAEEKEQIYHLNAERLLGL